MFDVLRFKSDAPASRVGATLALTPVRRVALVFPTGRPAAIAQPVVLQALADRARATHKQITIVGGDASLRAYAVAAGLAAATTLDDWCAARVAARDSRHASRGAKPPRLALVEPSCDAESTPWADEPDECTEALCEVELPEYVARLITPQQDMATEREWETQVAGRLRPLSPPSDVDTYKAAVLASEREEEEISDTIVATSGCGYDAGLAH